MEGKNIFLLYCHVIFFFFFFYCEFLTLLLLVIIVIFLNLCSTFVHHHHISFISFVLFFSFFSSIAETGTKHIFSYISAFFFFLSFSLSLSLSLNFLMWSSKRGSLTMAAYLSDGLVNGYFLTYLILKSKFSLSNYYNTIIFFFLTPQ